MSEAVLRYVLLTYVNIDEKTNEVDTKQFIISVVDTNVRLSSETKTYFGMRLATPRNHDIYTYICNRGQPDEIRIYINNERHGTILDDPYLICSDDGNIYVFTSSVDHAARAAFRFERNRGSERNIGRRGSRRRRSRDRPRRSR